MKKVSAVFYQKKGVAKRRKEGSIKKNKMSQGRH
jgi:hypothetical protein